MHILLFILYTALLCFAITRSGFLLKSGLSKKILVTLFLLYALVGCAHVNIAYYFFPNHGDIWQIFNYSVSWKHLLLNDIPAFKKEFFPDEFSLDIVGTHLGWSYYQLQGLVALQMVFNFLSFDNIYINTLLFCFLALYGKVALFRMLSMRYPDRAFMLTMVVFLIPSVLFWTSVIHKESVLFSCLGILLYSFQKLLRQFRAGTFFWLALSFFLIFITRKALFVPLFPALLIWWMAEHITIPRKTLIAGICAALVLIFFLPGWSHPEYKLLHLLSERQQEYFQLKGGSAIFLPAVDDSAGSFAKALPYALLNGLVMPLPGAGGKLIYSLFGIEMIMIWLLVIWSLVKKRALWDGFTAGFLVFALIYCLFIGYLVPFAGAITRYRSIMLPFLILPFLLKIKSSGVLNKF
jgi:hypothetical protein